jgi:flavin-dependent dehydrogenase
VPENIAGYTWDFPTQVDSQPMRCWGVYDSNLRAHKPRPRLQTFLAKEMQSKGYSLDQYELQGHPIRLYHPGTPLSIPRVLLVGDAAGVDPIFGEGISLALGFGKLAARELDTAFNSGDFSFKAYGRLVRRSSLGRSLIARWSIARILYRLHWDWFQRWFWRCWRPIIIPVAWLLVLNWGRRLK